MLKYFKFFYGYLGNAVFVVLFASLFVALLDGVGLTMFLPLLQSVDSGDGGQNLGNLVIIIDWLKSAGLTMTLTNVLVLIFVFFSLKGIARFIADRYRVVLQQRFANRMRLTNMRLLAGYDYQAFTGADSGRIQNTLSGEVLRVMKSFRNYFITLQQGIMLVVYVTLALVANPRFALMVAAGGLLSNFIFSRIYRVTKKASAQITRDTHSFQGFLIQSVSSFKYLKATNLIATYKKKVDQSVRDIENQNKRVGTMNALTVAIREPLVMLIIVVVILVQVNVFGGGIGAVILSLLLLYRGLNALNGLQANYNLFLEGVGAIDNMEAFSNELERSQERSGEKHYPGLSTEIRVQDLAYTYGDKSLLQDLSFVIKKNETLGIVGESGTGKTTLVNILCGLLKVPDGKVLVDGQDLNIFDLESFRDQIGYVTQEAHVFSDSVFNNVTFWEPDTPENRQRVRRALSLARAWSFVQAMPDGMDTVIGINGITLSGGQRQRISIARELYRNVELLILDEATSALDSQSEQLIQENIESLSGKYTMLIIAHRLSTIRKADKVLHLLGNGAYEIGTFEELREQSPEFRNMVDLQSIE
jgi:ABC-type multidrug transport system fused ATPase/permease subunit